MKFGMNIMILETTCFCPYRR